ncbi:MAG TPA: adenylate/guanylate cyclase domain-containing protein [Acetobacteraceae bacterium]|nr:adenylate/guanylate cyclase domain-containing protein [Acetobacteraceae bacterium]
MPSPASVLRSLRPSGVRQVRLCSGLVLLCYVSLHLTNHALGNWSLALMERGLLVQKFIWQGWIGTTALYLALTTHFLLGLYALYERRRLHWTPPELAQLLLGLAVPPLLANHLAVTRIAFSEFGVNKGYAQELYSFWIASPALGWIQLALLVVAWLHGCLGIAFWLRLKPWFARLRAPLLAVAILLPVLALLGYLQAGRAVVLLAQDPVWRAAATATAHVGTPGQNLWLTDLRNDFLLFDGTAVALVLLARLARAGIDRRRGRVCVSYPDGRRQYVPIGFSVMEASLLAGIPHAGLCGARARCSLCRVRVLGTPILPPPDEPERRVLARLEADSLHIRLACQLRPRQDVAVLPLVPPDAQAAFLHRRQQRVIPHEHFIAVMMVDMRGSTQLAAARLPYDNVFILGRFVAAVSAAVVQAGGVPNQFLGDGVLAIFGLDCDPRSACRQAVAAAALVARNIRQLSIALALELPRPIDFGIGVHCGQAVVGEIGFRDHVAFTALGDAPNVASRLESLTKELGCEAVISEDVLRQGGIGAELLALEFHLASLRGRAEPVAVRMFRDIERDLAAVPGVAAAVSRS